MNSVWRITTAVLLTALLWQHQALLRRHAGLLRHILPITRTYQTMESYRETLADHIRVTGSPPTDLQRWLAANVGARGKNASVHDAFGGDLHVVQGADNDTWLLVSCGPDGRCDTDDDLTVTLIAAGAAKLGRPW